MSFFLGNSRCNNVANPLFLLPFWPEVNAYIWREGAMPTHGEPRLKTKERIRRKIDKQRRKQERKRERQAAKAEPVNTPSPDA
jgi:hypothetical protein